MIDAGLWLITEFIPGCNIDLNIIYDHLQSAAPVAVPVMHSTHADLICLVLPRQISVSVMPPYSSRQDLTQMAEQAKRVKAFFKQGLGLGPFEETRAYMNFLVARDHEAALVGFLQELESQRTAMGISDIQLSLTSLEEVFLTIAKKVCAVDGRVHINAG